MINHIQLNIQLFRFQLKLLPNFPRREAAKLAKVPKKIRNVDGRQCSGKHHFFNPTSHGSQNGQVKFCARSGSQGLDKKQGIDFLMSFPMSECPINGQYIQKIIMYIYIYGYIYHPYTPNVSIYTSTMNPPWDIYIYWFWTINDHHFWSLLSTLLTTPCGRFSFLLQVCNISDDVM